MSSVLDTKTLRPMNMGKLGSATNIWGIGASIMSLINRDRSPDIDYHFPQKSVPRFTVNAQHCYSNELRSLLLKCVEYLPTNRISAQELLDEISANTAGAAATEESKDLANGMRAGEPVSEDVPVKWTPSVQETYRRGLTLDDSKAALEEAENAYKAEQAKMEAAYKEKKAAKKKADAEAKKEAARIKRAATVAKKKAKGKKK